MLDRFCALKAYLKRFKNKLLHLYIFKSIKNYFWFKESKKRLQERDWLISDIIA
jgi:hypothetical protein